MKTPEALRLVAEMVTDSRSMQDLHLRNAEKNKGRRNAIGLYQADIKNAKAYGERADALETLVNDCRVLRVEVTTLSGMLDYCVNDTAKGVELNRRDLKQVRAQLKVTKLVLGAIKS